MRGALAKGNPPFRNPKSKADYAVANPPCKLCDLGHAYSAAVVSGSFLPSPYFWSM
jgi:hypothetical protein